MKRLLFVSFFLMFIFLFTDSVYALSAAEVSSRNSECPVIELASANSDGSLVKVGCYDNYEQAKNIMNTTDNDNLVIVQDGKIVDAKYALIDYDQYTSLGYTNIYSDISLSNTLTYISGSYSDDAALIEVDYNSGRCKIKVGGVVGWIKKYENEANKTNVLYDIVPISWTTSPNYYQVTDDSIIHHFYKNVYLPIDKKYSSITIGRKPSMLNPGNYYSYDGNYFYSDLKTLLIDYKNGNYNNSVNSNNPFYNYYQYLSFRSQTNYNADNINQYLGARTTSNSKLYNTGKAFIDAQNYYGVNAILMLAIGINESGYGNSTISQTKNNLFGINAVDASPGQSATSFNSVSDCINDFAFKYLSGRFLQPGDFRYFGANLGNKYQGLTVKYASDAYWGEKAAHYYYDIDKYFGFQDYNYYSTAVLNSDYNNTVYAKKDPNGYNVSSKYYQYKKKGSAIIILDEVKGPSVNGNTTWYKVTSDPTIDGNMEYYDDNTYYSTTPRINYLWSKYVYVPAAYFTKITNGGGKINENPVIIPTPTPTPDPSPSPSPTPAPTPSPTPNIVSTEKILADSGLRISSNYLYGVSKGVSVSNLQTNLTKNGGIARVVGDGNVKTGMQVVINNVTYYLVIYGDVNGDGEISAVDYSFIKNYIMSSSGLDGIYKEAADVDKSGSISAVDYANVKNYIMGANNCIR